MTNEEAVVNALHGVKQSISNSQDRDEGFIKRYSDAVSEVFADTRDADGSNSFSAESVLPLLIEWAVDNPATQDAQSMLDVTAGTESMKL